MDSSALVKKSLVKLLLLVPRRIISENCSQLLLIKGIMAILDKKRLHLSGGSDTITISRGFLWKTYKNVESRIVGLLEVSDYGRNVLFLTGSRRKTQ